MFGRRAPLWLQKEFIMAQSTPLQFNIPDMDCQSCVKSITEAVHGIDKDAHVAADLKTKRVVVGSDAEAADIAAAIVGAGFSIEAAG
jgi:copper chaperone CopZ